MSKQGRNQGLFSRRTKEPQHTSTSVNPSTTQGKAPVSGNLGQVESLARWRDLEQEYLRLKRAADELVDEAKKAYVEAKAAQEKSEASLLKANKAASAIKTAQERAQKAVDVAEKDEADAESKRDLAKEREAKARDAVAKADAKRKEADKAFSDLRLQAEDGKKAKSQPNADADGRPTLAELKAYLQTL